MHHSTKMKQDEKEHTKFLIQRSTLARCLKDSESVRSLSMNCAIAEVQNAQQNKVIGLSLLLEAG
jgi:hypothetical protein